MKKRGYTMIELLVVMGIIGVLAMFLFVSYSRSQAKARDARRQADIGTITVSLESFYNDNNRYPTEDEITFGSPFGTYMSMVPNDPDPSKSYCYIPSEDGLSYTLGADYETTMEGVRCTPLDSTPAPTVPPVGGTPAPTYATTPLPIPTSTPTPTLIPTLTPTPTIPSQYCLGGYWVEVEGEVEATPNPGCYGNVTEGSPVGGGCDSKPCGLIITDCNHFDPSCEVNPIFGEGRGYTVCECRL